MALTLEMIAMGTGYILVAIINIVLLSASCTAAFQILAKAIKSNFKLPRTCRRQDILRCMCGSPEVGEKDDIEQQVEEELSRYVYQAATRLQAPFISLVLLFTSIAPVIKIFLLQDAQRLRTLAQDLMVMGVSCMMVLFHCLRKEERFSVNYWKAGLITMSGVFIATIDPEDPFSWYLWNGYLAIPRVITSLGCSNIKPIAVANVFFLACQISSYMAANPDKGWSVAPREIAISVALIILGWLDVSLVKNSVRNWLAIRMLSGELGAMKELLDDMCDASVEINQDMVFVKSCPRLSTMLMRASVNDLKDKKFTDFMDDENRQRLHTALMAKAPSSAWGDSKPGHLHVTLKDSIDNKVNVELYFVGFETRGVARFLVGIREAETRMLGEMPKFAPKRRKGSLDSVTTSASGAGTPAEVGGAPAGGQAGDLNVVRSQNSLEEDLGDFVIQRKSSEVVEVPSPPSSDMGSSMPSCTSTPTTLQMMPALRFPQLPPTTIMAKEMQLLRAMVTWNMPVPRAACCSYHAAVAEASKIIAYIRRTECLLAFQVYRDGQCNFCFALSNQTGSEEGELPLCQVCCKGSVVPIRHDELPRTREPGVTKL